MFKEGVGQELIQICGLEGLLSSLGEAIVDRPGAERSLPLSAPLPFHCSSHILTTDHWQRYVTEHTSLTSAGTTGLYRNQSDTAVSLS